MSEPKVFYEKRGRRYYPVSYYDSEFIDALPEGAHLIIVSPGARFVRYDINPDHAVLIAAARVAEKAMVDAILAASEFRQSGSEKLTEQEHKAFEEYKRLSGSSRLLMERGSVQEIAAAGVQALIEAAKGETA